MFKGGRVMKRVRKWLFWLPALVLHGTKTGKPCRRAGTAFAPLEKVLPVVYDGEWRSKALPFGGFSARQAGI